MQKFIVVTVEGAPYLVPFNDGVHKLWVSRTDDNPTELEVRADDGHRTVLSLCVEETPDEVLQLMDIARGQSLYYLAHVDLSRIDFGDDRSAFDAAMEELGFMTYAIMHRKGRAELPQGIYLFDSTLPRNKHLKYTINEARDHIQDAVTNVTGSLQYFTSTLTDRPLLTVAEARNVSWN
jgi:hypothetical protein